MTENKLPTGVGKKIVEALKKQDNPDMEISDFENQVEQNAENVGISSIMDEEINDTDFTEAENMLSNTDSQLTADNASTFVFHASSEPAQISFNNTTNNDFNFEPRGENIRMNNNNNEILQPKSFAMPSNVTVLKRLISQLPNGVTKQTGAQIIRQTMEALGISMNSVLAEAQQVQDGLNESIKDCMYSVNEYKQNIMTLEKQVSDYQKQVKSINDLVSLFILTDK